MSSHDDTGETREVPLDELMLTGSVSGSLSQGDKEEQDDEFSLGPKQPVIGEYVLQGRIGAGGNGRVFKAHHRQMERLVALKMLSAGLMRDPEAVRRFRREMKAAAKLFHPNIVTAFDAGEQDGIHYLVMEYVDGQSLTALVERHGPVSVDKAIDYIIQAARGLQYAHSRDVIHRDVKPSNLILDTQGVVKILDLGTARFQNDTAELTQAGVIMGTINYMAPEQARSASEVDRRTDIYGLGCTLYFLLTGKPLYDGNVMQVLLAHAEQPPPSVRQLRPDAPQWLETVLARMLAKSPQQRQATMDEVISELEQGAARSAGSFSARVLQHPSESQPQPAVGVDLGTTDSVIARLDKSGVAAVLACHGATTTPTAVSVKGMNVAVGRPALEQAALEHTAWSIKRELGHEQFPHSLDGACYPPEVLLALVLGQLVSDARAQIGPFRELAVAVPTAFNDVHRKAIEDAGYLADVEVVDLVNEPAAAALAVAAECEPPAGEEFWLTVDLGGGKLDAAVFQRTANQLNTRGLSGTRELGGVDWDCRLADLMADQIVACDGPDPRANPGGLANLARYCEQAKLQLTRRNEATLSFNGASGRVLFKMSRSRFRQLTADFQDQLLRHVEGALAMAELGWDDLDRVLLSGQGTRSPIILQALQKAAGREDLRWQQLPSGYAARGAALQADARLKRRLGQAPAIELTDLAADALGLVGIDSRNDRRVNAVLIPRGAPLPATTRRTFKTFRDGQDSIMIQIVQGEHPDADQCTPVGKCVINDLPPEWPAGTPVEVEFQCASSGRLTVYVESPGSGFRATKELVRESGLTHMQLSRWREWVETMLLCSEAR